MNAPNIKMLILDEADVMLEKQGLGDQTIRINNCLPASCQRVFFSATYNDATKEFADEIVGPNTKHIFVEREKLSVDNIKQFFVWARNKEDKQEALSNIYGAISITQSIIFTATKADAKWLSEKMRGEGHQVGLLSGDMTVEERLMQIERFRVGKEKVMITTNVSARGLDIPAICIVVNFDPPMDRFGRADYETYLHRIGRSGRFGRGGVAVNFVTNANEKKVIDDLAAYFQRDIEQLETHDIYEIEERIEGDEWK